MQPIHCVPVVTFPRAAVAGVCQPQQRRHHFVHFVLVVIHSKASDEDDAITNREPKEIAGTAFPILTFWRISITIYTRGERWRSLKKRRCL